MRPSTPGYWSARANYRYYAIVRRWLDLLSPAASLLDVGGGQTPVVTWGAFERRVAVDLTMPVFDDVECIEADFLTWDPPGPFDVVTCCQVLEHLPDEIVGQFARKLHRAGMTVLVSVPYRWPKGATKWHLQDPVDEAKLHGWMGRHPNVSAIVADEGVLRLVALYGDAVITERILGVKTGV